MKTLEQYQFATAKKNYRARLRRRLNRVANLSRRMDLFEVYLNGALRDIQQGKQKVDDLHDSQLECVCDGVWELYKEMDYLYSVLQESCVKRDFRFTKDDIFVNRDDIPERITFDWFHKTMNWLKNETEEDRHNRAKVNFLHWLNSYVSNCNCLSSCTEYEDVDDSYQDKIDGKVSFDYQNLG